MARDPKMWLSPNPQQCDVCHNNIKTQFIDGQTIYGKWANMCPHCHKKIGHGLGTGRGQLYKRERRKYF